MLACVIAQGPGGPNREPVLGRWKPAALTVARAIKRVAASLRPAKYSRESIVQKVTIMLWVR